MTVRVPRCFRVLLTAAILALTLFSTGGEALGDEPPAPNRTGALSRPLSDPGPHEYASCRYGVTVGSTQHADFSIVPKLNAGWYLDFAAKFPPAGPAEAEYVPMIRVSQDRTSNDCEQEWGYTTWPQLTEASLGALLSEYPGMVWIVGNEPDRIGQDDVCPQQYAQAYHDTYAFIKDRDPTAQVAVAGLVEVTPMRMDYLDIVWDSYLARYGEPMPVDVWSMHIYVLSETGLGDANLALGADENLAIPASHDCSDPDSFCHAEHDDVDLFVEQVVRMRQWMKDHGQQDKPLILTEFGMLKPFHFPDPDDPNSDGICSVLECPPVGDPPYDVDCFCDETPATFHPARVSTFLTSTFDYLRTAVDPALGFPADEHRLVQRWLWYRLASWTVAGLGHASNLADPAVTGPDGEWELTVVGHGWQDYVQAITPTVNLRATAVPTTSGHLIPGGDASVTLRARAVNSGDIAVTGTVTITFYADSGLTTPLGSATFDGVPGCATREVDVTLHTNWPGIGEGLHDYWFELDSAGALPEPNEDDNVGQGVVDVAGQAVFMPLALRGGSP